MSDRDIHVRICSGHLEALFYRLSLSNIAGIRGKTPIRSIFQECVFVYFSVFCAQAYKNVELHLP